MIKQVFYLGALLLTACQSTPEKVESLISCPEIRSQMCTRIYRPVCAKTESQQYKTYASDCTACSHSEVIGYSKGACVANEQK
mgnify:CR=1 FL=1